MKLTILGIAHRTGIAKKSGKPFEMCQIMVQKAIETVNSPTFQCTGHGFEVQSLDAHIDLVDSLENQKFPFEGTLKVESTLTGFGLRPLVVGVDPVPAANATSTKRIQRSLRIQRRRNGNLYSVRRTN